MTKKAFKRALIPSVIALVLCFAMLLGATYAWFTDMAASEGNIISSGNLGIDLLVKRPGDADYVSLKGKTDTAIFNYTLWEPGYTDLVYAQVKNTGNLALKYTMRIIPTGTVSKLAEVIDVYYKPAEVTISGRDLSGLVKIGTLKDVLDGASGVLLDDSLLAGEDDKATLALHMQETAGNEYQNLSIGDGFTIQIIATQFTAESDAIDDQYDASATFPEVETTAVPHPTVTEISAGTLNNVNGEEGNSKDFDIGLHFVANEDESDEFGDYICEFVLTFDQIVNGDTVDLYGEYADYGVIGQTAAGYTFQPGVGLNVLEAAHLGPVTYEEVITLVKEFNCYMHVTAPEAGLTATLQLVMTPPATEENPNPETIIIKSYSYTYGG